MSEVKKVKKAHPMDSFIQDMINFMNPEGSTKDGDKLFLKTKEGTSDLTEILLERNDGVITGYLVHEDKIIKINVGFSQTWKPTLEIRFGEMFVTSMAVDNKKGLDMYLKRLYDKKPPKSKKNDCTED
ncbi:hypothetical protein D6_0029 [Aeromonas phage D6]|uniref:Uncharacterized protein n=1 Tax=Aeromonas phage D6 TaxID=2593322 RepID=A0A514TVZ0_9CAUD|nr:hypothetical protein PQC08_gp246 [Aeromonas phage D6]QDJ97189.1 hypothetical protein D6_0029 [Aeromonas phage D6]